MFENLRWNILTRNRNYEGPRVRKQGAEEFFGRGIYDTLVQSGFTKDTIRRMGLP